MMIGYDIYDRFTMEHFPLRQSMILTTSFFLLATVYTVCTRIGETTLVKDKKCLSFNFLRFSPAFLT
jgi:hypothetical protein